MAVGVVVGVALIGVPLMVNRPDGPGPAGPTSPGPGGPTPTPPPDARSRVPVEGVGVLLRERDGAPIQLCAEVMTTSDWPTSAAGCGPVAVVTTGVDPSWLVHHTTRGQSYSNRVRVEGAYGGGTLAVERLVEITPDPPTNPVEPPIPCAAPPGGWRPGYGLPAPDDGSAPDEGALNRLVELVRAAPERFADVWEGHPDGPPGPGAPGEPGSGATPSRAMLVVGVPGSPADLARARAELAAVYPGNLCVHPVRYSAAELARVAERLRAIDSTPIAASASVVDNRVRVRVVALDPPTVAILEAVGRNALMIEEPLLQWLD